MAAGFLVAMIALQFFHGVQGNVAAVQQLDWYLSLLVGLLVVGPGVFLSFLVLAPSRLADEDRQNIQSLQAELGSYENVDVDILVGTTPQFEKLTSINPAGRLMRIGASNPTPASVERVVMEVEEIADVDNVWPTGYAVLLPYTLRQSRDWEHRQSARFWGPLRGRQLGTASPPRDLEMSFRLDGHATEYLDFAEAQDADDSIVIYSTLDRGVRLRPSPRYEFTLSIHGSSGLRSKSVTIICERRDGRWQLRVAS